MSYGSIKRGYDQGVVSGGVDLRLRRITSSPSQTLRRRLVRTTDDGRRRECSARRLPPSVAALFFTLRDSYGWQHCRPVCSETIYSSRIAFLPTPPAFAAPVRGGFRWSIAIPFGVEKLEWWGYPTVNKFRRYLYSFWRNSRTWQTHTHRQTHGQTPHDGIGRAYASHRAAKMSANQRYSSGVSTLQCDNILLLWMSIQQPGEDVVACTVCYDYYYVRRVRNNNHNKQCRPQHPGTPSWRLCDQLGLSVIMSIVYRSVCSILLHN